MTQKQPQHLASSSIRLKNDASVELLEMNDAFWPRLMAGELGDFHHEFLVSLHDFTSDWPSSEVHPKGDEIVVLLSGSATFQLVMPEGIQEVRLESPGSYVFVPKGVWHTAKIAHQARMLFITAGEDTQHRQHDH